MNSQPQRSSEQQQATGLAPAKAQAQSVENWVQCDRCGKWRRVREDLLDDLDDASNWYCEDNPDEQHNHCNVPQEMTNDEIDRGRAMETLAHERMKRQRRPAVWQLIRCDTAVNGRNHQQTYLVMCFIGSADRSRTRAVCSLCTAVLTTELEPWPSARLPSHRSALEGVIMI